MTQFNATATYPFEMAKSTRRVPSAFDRVKACASFAVFPLLTLVLLAALGSGLAAR